MTKKTFSVLAVVILLAGFGTYKFLHKSPADIEPAAGEAGAQGPMPVVVQTLTKQEVQTSHQFSGKLVAVDRVQIRPRVAGAIEKVYFQPGAIVEKGEPLFLIDPRPYKAALSQATAAVATARAQSSLANSESERAQRLIKENAISQKEFDARVNTTKVANAAIQAAEALQQQARLNLDYATITSPVRGKIGRAEITEGNLVAPEQQQYLAEVVSVDPIYADFDVDEATYLENAHQATAAGADSGMPVSLMLKSNPDMTFNGKIVSFDNKLDTQSGTIRARAIFENTNQALVPGMYATVQMGSDQTVSAVVISERYVTTDQDKKVVYAIDKDNKVEYRPIKLGESVGNQRIVLEGLQAGDRIIVKDLQRVRPGTPVQPTEAEEAPAEQQPAAGAVSAAPKSDDDIAKEQEETDTQSDEAAGTIKPVEKADQ